MRPSIIILSLLFSSLAISQSKIYWVDGESPSSVKRVSLTGSDFETLIDSLTGDAEDIVIDQENQVIYWTEWLSIWRANLDGSNPIPLISTGLIRADGIDLDPINEKIYWTERGYGKIQRANFDGSSVQTVIESPEPESIALDVDNEKVYWTDRENENEKICRANFDGTAYEVLVEPENGGRPFGIALDLKINRIYWTDFILGSIHRSNLDGTEIEEVLTDLDNVVDLALDLVANKIYWIQRNETKVGRSNLDGSQKEELVVSNVGFPRGMALFLDENTSLQEVVTPNMELYPNPNSGFFKIKSDELIETLSLSGMDGKIIKEYSIDSFEYNFDLSEFKNGFYFIRAKIKPDKEIIKKTWIE